MSLAWTSSGLALNFCRRVLELDANGILMPWRSSNHDFRSQNVSPIQSGRGGDQHNIRSLKAENYRAIAQYLHLQYTQNFHHARTFPVALFPRKMRKAG